MRRPKLALILIAAAAIAALAVPAGAQDIGATIRIVPVPDGATIGVDGVYYNHAVTLVWPVGTKHTLVGITDGAGQLSPAPVEFATQYSFRGWQIDGRAFPGEDGISKGLPAQNPIAVTADPRIHEIRAIFERSYALRIAFFDCPDPTPAKCASPGTVYVGSQKVISDLVVYRPEGTVVDLFAIPNDNYVFKGWEPGENQVIAGFINTVTLKSPTVVQPRFVYGRRVNLATEPAGLAVMADRTKTPTPAALDWGIHTTHTLGPVTPQKDLDGRWWAFHSWSTGAAAIHAYEVDYSTTPVAITAKYVPVAVTQVSTLPPGLAIKVDGRDNWDSFNFPWGTGETHKVEAPAQLTDEQGRIWKFRSWSDGGEAIHTITAADSPDAPGARLIATYDPMARLLIKSSMPGLRVSIDDAECTTPCDIQRDLNTKVNVKAPASISMGENVRSDFSGWRGSGTTAAEWSGTLRGDPVTITADYHTMNRLSASADPPDGVSWRLTPASEDGYYDAKAAVSVSVTALAGFRFRGWSGDLSGNTPSGMLAMNSPRVVRAMLDRIPYVGPSGVSNAAGATPRPAVAPGSVASIFGVNLTTALVIGPEMPLAQTLGGLTVRLGDRFLPLFFVSPSQVNLQLPSDLGEGTQVLTVSVVGSPDVRTSFSVVRAAPGIFTQPVNGELFAVAAHEDGSPVTLESPARKGELLTVYGTGFGPTNRPRPEGFPVPAGAPFLISDTVGVQVSDIAVVAVAAFASAGRVGVDVVQFRLGDDVPSGMNVPLRLSINGQESNLALLPIQ